MSAPPAQPKIYHIVHVDRLPSILASGGLLCDATVVQNSVAGTTIGMGSIKSRRLTELQLGSQPGLFVGGCVPFYFCPRSIMLFMISRGNAELSYTGGQGPIIHLEADLRQTVTWAEQNRLRWAFTLSNAGAYYFEDRADLSKLHEINWEAVEERLWSTYYGKPASVKEGKQAEFLVEGSFPWGLVSKIGVHSQEVMNQVHATLNACPQAHKPAVSIQTDWYY